MSGYRRWGQGHEAGEAERRADGRFRSSVACDACGRGVGSLNDDSSEWYTDNEVCGCGDGPGFYLCARASCRKRYAHMDVEERRVFFTLQREKNEAARKAASHVPRTGKPAPTRSYTRECLRVLDTFAINEVVTAGTISTFVGREAVEPVMATLLRFGRFEAVGPGTWRRVS